VLNKIKVFYDGRRTDPSDHQRPVFHVNLDRIQTWIHDCRNNGNTGMRTDLMCYMRWTPLSRQKIDLIKDDGPASRWMIQLRSSDQSPFLQHPFVRGLF
jgi:hypothetical protein